MLATRLWAASLAVGLPNHLSFECAAGLADVPSFPVGRVVLTAGRGTHHRIDGATVHQLGDVLPEHLEIDPLTGLDRTTLPRTVVDLAAVVRPSHLEHVVSELVAARRTDERALARCLGDVARPGKPGVKRLGRVLDARVGGTVPPRSWLERRLFEIVAESGLPRPIPQYRFPGRQDVDGCVDGAWVEVKTILEADGRRWHARIADLKRDSERDLQAARAGWLTLRLMHETMAVDPDGVGSTLAEVYEGRRRQAA